MRSFKFIALLVAIGSSGCASSKPAVSSVVNDPSFRPVPPSVIAKLPQKIARLPVTKFMSMDDFLGALDLENYNSNTQGGGVRFCSYFMKLDQDQLLQIRCLPESLIISSEDIDRLLASTLAGPAPAVVWPRRAKVVGCTLRKGWNDVIAHRWLAERKTEPFHRAAPQIR
jgi:hypothetical protein